MASATGRRPKQHIHGRVALRRKRNTKPELTIGVAGLVTIFHDHDALCLAEAKWKSDLLQLLLPIEQRWAWVYRRRIIAKDRIECPGLVKEGTRNGARAVDRLQEARDRLVIAKDLPAEFEAEAIVELVEQRRAQGDAEGRFKLRANCGFPLGGRHGGIGVM